MLATSYYLTQPLDNGIMATFKAAFTKAMNEMVSKMTNGHKVHNISTIRKFITRAVQIGFMACNNSKVGQASWRNTGLYPPNKNRIQQSPESRYDDGTLDDDTKAIGNVSIQCGVINTMNGIAVAANYKSLSMSIPITSMCKISEAWCEGFHHRLHDKTTFLARIEKDVTPTTLVDRISEAFEDEQEAIFTNAKPCKCKPGAACKNCVCGKDGRPCTPECGCGCTEKCKQSSANITNAKGMLFI
eukprot:TRINITY_DN58_c0_g1_i17.p1 TRINITY_DN58_c0_g1~~TRINITY_DN58_c0_g1_i17.p1  ORF type:complete len:244 (+),score=66.13 TRINITY_DN58_c0_g1_i17:1539-2270(+)